MQHREGGHNAIRAIEPSESPSNENTRQKKISTYWMISWVLSPGLPLLVSLSEIEIPVFNNTQTSGLFAPLLDRTALHVALCRENIDFAALLLANPELSGLEVEDLCDPDM